MFKSKTINIYLNQYLLTYGFNKIENKYYKKLDEKSEIQISIVNGFLKYNNTLYKNFDELLKLNSELNDCFIYLKSGNQVINFNKQNESIRMFFHLVPSGRILVNSNRCLQTYFPEVKHLIRDKVCKLNSNYPLNPSFSRSYLVKY